MTQPTPIPAPRFKSERLNFPDTGDYWDIRATLTVGLDREFSDIALKSQLLLKPDANPEMVTTLAQRMDAFVLKCTTGWSYGEVNEATLHNEVPASHYQKAGDLMVARYSPLVLARLETLLSASSSLSSQEANSHSPTSSASPISPT